MAYVNVLDWKAEQVAEWLRGLEDTVYPYAHFFLNNDVTGQVSSSSNHKLGSHQSLLAILSFTLIDIEIFSTKCGFSITQTFFGHLW